MMDGRITFPEAFDARRRTTTLALVCAAGLAATGKLASAAEKSTTHKVIIKATSYSPMTLTVKRGDTVVWVNEDPFPHTVTAEGAFDSKSIAAGASWKYKARKAGEYAYTCTFHPNMKGTLTVE
jgi:plastocyanin